MKKITAVLETQSPSSHRLEKQSAVTEALKTQSLFSSYQLQKQLSTHRAIVKSRYVRLLQAFDLRFQCMRAVAAAKLLLNQPIEDREQARQLIEKMTAFAQKKGIHNTEEITALFHQNILLAERIQTSYYHRIWKHSSISERDQQQLTTDAYNLLTRLVSFCNLPVFCDQGNSEPTSMEVLYLARDIIQHASCRIIELLASPTAEEISAEEFAELIKKILSNYMTPHTLTESEESIALLTESVKNIKGHGYSVENVTSFRA
jgi:chorismate mutase